MRRGRRFRVAHRNGTVVTGKLKSVGDESVLLRDGAFDVEIEKRYIAGIETETADQRREFMVALVAVFVTIAAYTVMFFGFDIEVTDTIDKLMVAGAVLAMTSGKWVKFTPARRLVSNWEAIYPPPGTEIVEGY